MFKMFNRSSWIKYVAVILILLIGLFFVWAQFEQKEFSKNEAGFIEYADVDSILNLDSRIVDNKIKELSAKVSNSNLGTDQANLYFYKLKKAMKAGQLDSVPFFIENGVAHAKLLDNEALLFNFKRTAGYYYLQTSQYVKSLEAFQEALTYTTEKDEVKNAHIFMGMAGIYYYLDDLDQAIYFCEAAFNVFEKLKIKSGMSSYYGNMAGIYAAKGEDDKTAEFIKRSLVISSELNDSITITINLNALGALALKNKDFTNALSYFDKAFLIASKINNGNLQSDILCNYGEVYEQKGNLDKASDYYNQANNIEGNTSLRTKMIRLYALARISELKGDYKLNSSYLKEYYSLSEQVKGSGVTQNIEKLKWENLLREQELKQQLEKQRFEFKSYLYIAITFLALSLIALFYSMYKNKSKSLKIYLLENENLEEVIRVEKELKNVQEKAHEQELEVLNKELTSLNILMLTKNNFVSELKDIVSKSKSEPNPTNVLNSIRHSVNRLSNVEQDWGQFQQVFQKVHPEFFNTIQSKFPSITKGELRICAYIKINMSNNEMASLLNVEQRSIITNRYRIRKKMDLDAKLNLDEFIQSL